MALLRNLASGLRSLFRRKQVDRELDEEVRAYLQMASEEKMKQGMSRKEAVRAVRLERGSLEVSKEIVRSGSWESLVGSCWQDLRFSARMLRMSPGFTSVAVPPLALCIGANTAIFTLLDASLWRPLAVSDPKEIFHVMRASSQGDFAGEFSYSYPIFQQFSKTASPWGEVFATEVVGPRKFGLKGVSDERVAGEAVSGNFLSVLNGGPIVGRVLEPQDDNVLGGNHVAVLSYAFWKRRFQSDALVLGRRILYDETPYTVVGIARPGFTGIEPEVSVDVWVPITAGALDRGWRPDPNISWLRLLVRLHDGVDPKRAQAMFEAAFRTHVADVLLPSASPRFKQMLEAQHITVRPAASGLATTGRKYEKPLLVLFAVVGVVLLISCANIANLMLASNAARQLEMTLHGGQRIIGSTWSGRLLLAGQLALSLPLLVGAGLFVDTLHNLKSSDLGFHAENVVTFDLSYPKGTADDRLHQAYAEIKRRLESHPGVIVASYGSSVYGDGGWSGGVDVIGNPSSGKDNDVGLISAGPGFFEAIGLGLLQGRYLRSQDQTENTPVAVVNESFARHYFGSNSAIGQRIKLAFEPQVIREIVGVVRDAKHYGVRERVWRMVYLPARKG